MQAINPATGQVIRDYPELGDAEIVERLTAADEAFSRWRRVPFAQRGAKMCALAALLDEQKERLAEIITDEMGKPITQSVGEIEKCAWVCEFFAEHAEALVAPRVVATEAAKSYVRFDPLGVILAVMPWNFPFWQVFRFAAPAIMAGNVGVLKHASNVPGCALAIDEAFQEAGFAPDVFQSLPVENKQVDAIISHPVVKAVTLTGSEKAGQAVGSSAGQNLKKSVLELGGSDPFIVLADADLPAAAELAVRSRTINGGQSCIAAKRFVVEEPVADEFTRRLVAAMEALRIGDPRERTTQIGPLAREDLLHALHEQVQRSVSAGAELATGGACLDRPGFFYVPTVLTHVRPGMPAFDEETFGPVAAVIVARDADHAVELANHSRYGLGASIASADRERAEELAARIEAGSVFINEMVKSDPRLPFGGIKQSGYGRELAEDGIREFVNIKTVWVE
jgi:succinate-semialdehyde dehydrogenase/glutarate-semialdehyde dehydrogenase